MTWIEKLQTLTALQFENMLDQAIYDEEHTTVIFHINKEDNVSGYESWTDWIEKNGGFLFDYETDAETGNAIGTRILPNENGDYVIEIANTEFGVHRINQYLTDAEKGLTYGINDGSEFYIDKDNHEFYSLVPGEPQVTTQQEI